MTPWPACVHGDDPTVCPTCWEELEPELERQARKDRRPWRRLRVWWWQVRFVRKGDPF